MSIQKETSINKLLVFKLKDKFSDKAWEECGLNPSDIDVSKLLAEGLNDCIDALLTGINNNDSSKKLKKTLLTHLSNLPSQNFDTEEKEFVSDYFFYMSEIIDVNIKNELNKWMYGAVLSTLFKISDFFGAGRKIIQTVAQDCVNCNASLKTHIYRFQDGIPGCYQIVKCNTCNEYNLMEPFVNAKEFEFEGYVMTEQFDVNSYTAEQAKIRLEQLKHLSK